MHIGRDYKTVYLVPSTEPTAMSLPRVRFTIRGLMVAVAVIAVLLAWLDVRAALALAGLYVVVMIPAVIAPPGRRLEAASRACSVQQSALCHVRLLIFVWLGDLCEHWALAARGIPFPSIGQPSTFGLSPSVADGLLHSVLGAARSSLLLPGLSH